MPDITKGKTFSSGDTVTASDLNNLVDDAVINDNAINSDKIEAGAISNSKISSSAAISFSKLESLATGSIIVGDSGAATVVALSGDATISTTGALTIAADAVETAMIKDSTGASDGITTAKLATGAATGPKIAMGSDAQGDVLYHNGTNYVRLAAGTSGQLLKTQGSSANPAWVDPPPAITITAYTTTATWTRPAGVTLIHALVFGGGGGGAALRSGGHGGVVSDYIDVSGTLGGAGDDEIEIIIGAGGAAGHGKMDFSGEADGGVGGDTSFGLDGETAYLVAVGGQGAQLLDNSNSHGLQGSVTTTRSTAINYSCEMHTSTDTVPSSPPTSNDLAYTEGYGGGAIYTLLGDESHGAGHTFAGVAGTAGAVVITIIG